MGGPQRESSVNQESNCRPDGGALQFLKGERTTEVLAVVRLEVRIDLLPGLLICLGVKADSATLCSSDWFTVTRVMVSGWKRWTPGHA